MHIRNPSRTPTGPPVDQHGPELRMNMVLPRYQTCTDRVYWLLMCVCARVCMCVCVCFTWLRQLCGLDSYLAQVLICLIQILFAIIAIRENLWVHIQCICRFACFSCDGRIYGTWCCSSTFHQHPIKSNAKQQLLQVSPVNKTPQALYTVKAI